MFEEVVLGCLMNSRPEQTSARVRIPDLSGLLGHSGPL